MLFRSLSVKSDIKTGKSIVVYRPLKGGIPFAALFICLKFTEPCSVTEWISPGHNSASRIKKLHPELECLNSRNISIHT